MRRWLATLLPLALLVPAYAHGQEKQKKEEKIDAQMLLELDLLADESFAADAEDERRLGIARESEMLERLDWLEQDVAGSRDASAAERRRR